jgi:hypothetical protein
VITNDLIIAEANRCRDLLAYAAELGGRKEIARLLSDVSFTPEGDFAIVGTSEETERGLVVVHNIREMFAAARLNLGLYEHSKVAECGLYAYRLTWERS